MNWYMLLIKKNSWTQINSIAARITRGRISM
jgi:hypothetical protein